MRDKKVKLYIEVYEHYKKLIVTGQLKPGKKLPSIRKTCDELGVSKTTAENAYFQLTADGYVIPKEKSGYYITDMAERHSTGEQLNSGRREHVGDERIKYDFAKIGEDSESFCFELWQKYMKSAMRDYDRLLSYGSSQGEEDLREEISEFVRRRRNIICSPEQIIIGAGTQNLLHILLPLLKDYSSASVPTIGFKEYAYLFENYGFKVGIRQKECGIIYVAPAHMTEWGEIMPLKRRYELVEHSRNGHFVIEDDYLNEFVHGSEYTPSLFALSGGNNVAYLGSFSRVLLPSIRISFMILPVTLAKQYNSVKKLFMQTASKTEQLALCSFLRDGHLEKHIKKLKRIYARKMELLLVRLNEFCDEIKRNMKFDAEVKVLPCDAGTEAGVLISNGNGGYTNTDLLRAVLRNSGVDARVQKRDESILLLFSCSIIKEHYIFEGLETASRSLIKYLRDS